MKKSEANKLCEKLWLEYEPLMRKISIYKLQSRPSEIDEVVAEAYLALCEAVHSNKKINDYKSWLYATVNNLIKIKYNDSTIYKNRFVELNDELYQLSYNIDFIDEMITDDDIDEILETIYSQMDLKEKLIAEYSFDQNLPFKEIGDKMGITEDAAKQRRYRLALKVKKLVKDEYKKYPKLK